MVSKAQLESQARYDKREIRRVVVKFTSVDRDIQRYPESKPSMGGYLKQLLRHDYEKNGSNEEGK